ncbi:MAG TPA: methyltransferase [Candidatus Sulfopaludibacter sp.]|jgi:SAM-dependent methyltransferase|nr:methyltransferase [Candidatus Sulfopaludibacter sp.]
MSSNWFEKQPRLGSPEEFAALRALLAESGYHEAGLQQELDAMNLRDYKTPAWNDLAQRPVLDALDVLILLFFDGIYVDQEVLDRLLPAHGVATLEALDLLAGEGRRYGTVAILTVGPILTICDRSDGPDMSHFDWPADVVYPATSPNSREFQRTLPQTPCDALLDLGTGTGIAALAAAATAKHVWGADIAARSVLFAAFNCKLNAIENATMVQGDLYGAVTGLTFDRIVAHPPYVPARNDTMIFRDAGKDGEQILRRIIEGLPEFLRPGGRFYTLVTAADCEGQSFEDRIRLWLGAAEAEFDLAMVSHTLTSPKDLVGNMIAKHNTPMEDVLYRQELWAQRKVIFLFYGTVVIQRHAEERPSFTARVQKGEGYRTRHAEWLLNWHTAAGETARLMDCHPSISPRAELDVVHRVREGRLVPEVFSLRTSGPFATECVVQSWLAKVVSQCNGRTTWGHLMESARTTGLIDAATTPEEFASVLTAIAGSGLLHIPEMPLEQ